MSYWQKRQEAMYRAGEMKVNKYFTRLEKAFKQTQRELQKTIESFYFRYAEENGLTYAAAQQKLDKAEIGELKDFIELSMANIGKYNQEVNNMSIKARITRYQALETQIDAMLRQLYAVDYQAEAEKTMEDVYGETYYQTWYNIDQYRGFHSAFAQVDPTTVETLLEYPFNGADFSSRLWKQKDHLQTVLMESVTTMLVQGVPPQNLAGDVAKKMKSKVFDAYRLLHTESSFLMSEATHAGYREDGVEKYQILATLDSKTCGICGDLDGNIYTEDEAVVGKNMPPFHYLCRCTDVPYYDDMDLSDQTRAARDPETGETILVPADMTYKDWYNQYVKGHPEAELNEKMIRNRASDRKLFNKYKAVLKEKVPDSLDSFQKMKYTDIEGWKALQDEIGLMRKSKNSGAFAHLPERMSKKHIRELAKEYGIGMDGLSITIDKNEELLRLPLAGRADPESIGGITFFPNAFKSREELVRTLYHEKQHVLQYKEYGVEYVQNHRKEFEGIAYSAENEFVEKLKKEGRL